MHSRKEYIKKLSRDCFEFLIVFKMQKKRLKQMCQGTQKEKKGSKQP